MQTFYVANAANLWLATTGLVLVLTVAVFVLGWQLRRLRGRYRQAMSLGSELNIEDALIRQAERWQETSGEVRAVAHRLDVAESTLRQALRRVAVVRFSAFADTGGDQSFSVALLDDGNSGVVFSSLHGRDGTRIYAKPVTNGTSRYTLSAEEVQAIEASRQPAGSFP